MQHARDFVEPFVSLVTPQTVLASGGSVVTVTGGGFAGTPDFLCRFGGRTAPGVVISDSEATCLPMPGLSGFLPLEVSTNGYDYTESGVLIRAFGPYVSSVSPRDVPAWAPTVVTLHGKSMEPLGLQGGGMQAAVPGPFVSSRQIVLEVNPPSGPPEPIGAELSVAVPEFGTNLSLSFGDIVLEDIVEDNPMVEGGGGTIKVVGGPFGGLQRIYCHIGTVAVTATTVTPGEGACALPRGAPGMTTVSLSFSGQHRTASRSKHLRASLQSDIQGLHPTSGPSHGGTMVTAFTEGSYPDQGTDCIISGQRIKAEATEGAGARCTMPPGAAGFVGVSLSGVPSSEGPVFLYREAAQVHSAAPRAAWRGGATLVHVSGRNLEGSEGRCRAAGAGELPARRASSALLVCEVAPEADDPAAEVRLVVGSLEQQHLELSWSEDGGPPAVAPASGGEGGGAVLEVRGGVAGEVKGVHCRVGTFGPVAGRREDARSLECLAPAHVPGRVSVGSALNAQVWAPGAEFTYEPGAGQPGEALEPEPSPPQLTPQAPLAGAAPERVAAGELALAAGLEVRVGGLEPTGGPASGGTVVRVLGEGLQHGLACSFGTVVGVTSRWRGGGELECVSPAHAPGVAGVEVEGGVALGPAAEEGDGAAGWLRSRGGAQFSYARDAVFLSVEPGSGPARGGTEVVALGEGLLPGPVSCMAGGRAAPGEAVSSVEARCSMPPGAAGFVGVSLSGVPSSEGPVFLYREAAQVHSAAPRAAWRGGATLVHVSGRNLEGSEGRCRAAGAGELPARRVSSALLVCEIDSSAFEGSEAVLQIGSSDESFALSVFGSRASCSQAPLSEGGGGVIECVGLEAIAASQIVDVFVSVGSIFIASTASRSAPLAFSAPAHGPGSVPVRLGFSGSMSSQVFEVEYVANAVAESSEFVALDGGRIELRVQSVGLGSLALPAAFGECKVRDQIGAGLSQISSHLCHFDNYPRPGFSAVSVGVQKRHNSNIEFSVPRNPIVQSIYPDIGLLSGATVSFVRGGHLADGSMCSFGNSSDPSLFVSSALVRCVSPASPHEGVDEVRLATNRGQVGLGGTFEFQSTIHLDSIGVVPKFGVFADDPNVVTGASGPDDGGTEALVYGRNFMERLKTFCRFGTTAVTAHAIENSRVKCISPAHADGVVPVEISQNGLDYSVGGPKFDFYA